MNRILASLSIGVLLTASAAAQACLNTASPGTFLFADDEVNSVQMPLGLTYPNPFGGALPGGYTHCIVSTNGWILLTDGVSTAGDPGTFEYGDTDADYYGLRGGAGHLPLLAPYWGDEDQTGAAVGEGVFIKASTGPGVPAEITWIATRDYSYTPKKSCKALIYATGVVKYQYEVGFLNQGIAGRFVGISARNNIATVPAQVDLSVGGSDTNGMMYQVLSQGTFDLGGREITFTPVVTGGWTEVVTCITPAPTTEVVGNGCYTFSESMYQHFTNGGAASAALSGNVLILNPTGPVGYSGTWVPGAAGGFWVPPSGATSLPASDDGADTITPSVPFNAPNGSFAQVTISHNGILTLGATANNAGDYTPNGVDVATSTGTAFYAWADYYDGNVTPSPSGQIKYHEATVGLDQVLYITWDGVHRWAAPLTANINTWQFQANLTTGQVTIVWLTMDPSSTSNYGNNQLIGMTGPGAIATPGAQLLDRQYPLLCEFGTANVLPLTLGASPNPGVNLSGTTVPLTWTVTNVPEASHIGPMVRACNIVFSIGGASTFYPGLDLGPLGFNIGAGGCRLHVGSFDAFVDVSAVNGTGICTLGPLTFSGPPSLIGLVVTTQAFAIFPPNSGKGGVNNIGAHGLLTSNAIRQVYNPL